MKHELLPFQKQFLEWLEQAKEKIVFSEPQDPTSWEVTPLDAAYCAFELPKQESTIDQFDRMTKEGFKLNMVTGEWSK